MLNLPFAVDPRKPLNLLCLGAHSDDIEIGCGGLLLTLAEQRPEAHVRYIVFSAGKDRAEEARSSAAGMLGAQNVDVEIFDFSDGLLPSEAPAIKATLETIKRQGSPDLILTHRIDDLHQDHALIGTMTRNTFRDHLIFEYEIPKYDGDLRRPNAYFPLSQRIAATKARHIHDAFGSQRSRQWFSPETFLSVARIRGIECNAPDGYAEGFHVPKCIISL